MAIVINGSGTVTGLAVGGLPDGTVDADTVAADVATQAEIDAKLNLSGGTMTGDLTVSGASTPKVTVKSNDGTSASLKLQRVNENDASTDFELKNNAGDLEFFGDNSSQNDYKLVRFGTTEHRYYTNNTERMRLRNDGALHIGTENAASTDLKFKTNYVNGNIARFNNDANSNPYGIALDFDAASPDDATRYFLLCIDSTTTRLRINSDGDVQNHDNSYGATSDERIKQDIRDSNSQWDDIKNIRIRNFKKKDDVRQYGENAWEQIGVVAQELETVSPKLIRHADPTPSDILSDSSFGTLYEEGDEIPEDKNIGDVKEINHQVKSVSYSVLYMKAIKALQEAMSKIEDLEARITALEA